MTATSSDVRLLANLFLAGAVLAVVGNATHPFLPADASAEDVLARADASWVVIHLVIGAAIVLLVVALVLLPRVLEDTAGATLGRVAAVVGLLGGTIFLFQIAAVDGVGNAMMADAVAAADGSAPEALLAAAVQIQAVDIALLSLAITLLLGVTFVLVGFALQRAGTFSAWVGWLAIVGGAVATVTGILLAVQGPTDLALIYLFRPAALVVTVAAFGLGVDLRRQASAAGVPALGAG